MTRLGWLALMLAMMAGGVDAIGLAAAGCSSSHMTGTTTHSLAEGVDGHILLALLGMLAILCFILGAIGAGVVVNCAGPRRSAATLPLLIGLETILVLAGGGVMALLPAEPWDDMTVIGCFAAAASYRETMFGAALPIVGFVSGALGGALLHVVAGRWSGIAGKRQPKHAAGRVRRGEPVMTVG